MPLLHISPHQFGVATEGGCESIIQGIRCTLDLYLEWVVLQLDVANAFNLVLRGVIFQQLRVAGEFYAFEYHLFYSHHNCEGDVTVIPFVMGTRQGDHLGRALFALAQFRALHFTPLCFISCLFPSITDGTHIISPF
jgi:hypothetical protein